MKAGRPIGTIIVGAGYFGQKRLDACKSLQKEYRVVGVVDTDKKVLQHISKKYHVPVSASLSLFTNKADLAIIATPNAYHTKQCIDALSLGLHVLCEKPLATNYRDALRIVAASKRYRRFVKTGSNHRFIPYVEKAIELVKKGAVGKVLSINGAIGNNGAHVAGRWFWNPKLSGGGTLLDNGCHLVDIVRLLLGGITRCSAHTATLYWKKARTEDTGSAIFVTKDGRQAVISSSWTRWDGYLSLEVFGDKGCVITDSATENVVVINKNGTVTAKYNYSKDKTSSYQKELLYMKACIERGVAPKPDAKDGARVIQLIEAAYQSSRKKTWITL